MSAQRAESAVIFPRFSDSLDFRSYAAAFSQARRRVLISVGVAGWGSVRRNCGLLAVSCGWRS